MTMLILVSFTIYAKPILICRGLLNILSGKTWLFKDAAALGAEHVRVYSESNSIPD
jgi:hypothetical protein